MAEAALTLPRPPLVDPLPETHCCIDPNAQNFMSLVLLLRFTFLVFVFGFYVFIVCLTSVHNFFFFIVRVGSLGSAEYGDPWWSDPLPATPGIKQEEVLGEKNGGKKGVSASRELRWRTKKKKNMAGCVPGWEKEKRGKEKKKKERKKERKTWPAAWLGGGERKE
jgi:hypothetical protein